MWKENTKLEMHKQQRTTSVRQRAKHLTGHCPPVMASKSLTEYVAFCLFFFFGVINNKGTKGHHVPSLCAGDVINLTYHTTRAPDLELASSSTTTTTTTAASVKRRRVKPRDEERIATLTIPQDHAVALRSDGGKSYALVPLIYVSQRPTLDEAPGYWLLLCEQETIVSVGLHRRNVVPGMWLVLDPQFGDHAYVKE
jgi:hypothetical protein